MTRLDDTIQVSSIREHAARRIRAAIIYGEIEPGKIHSAPALAARMGVSITPVREALLELVSRGMVVQVRNRGFRVVERTPEELEDALELRTLVEVPMMVRLAGRAHRIEAAQLEELRELVESGVKAAGARDFDAFLDLDRSFHLGLLGHAGNWRVVELVDQLLDQLRFAPFRAPESAASMVAVAEGHRAILAAIEAGDAQACERATREHLALSRTAWINDVAEEGD